MSLDTVISSFSTRKPDEALRSVKAFFQFPVLPEYLTSEVLLSSCYRALGYSSLRDAWISSNGKMLWKLVSEEEGFCPSPFNRNEVRRLLRDVLLSPEDPKQKRGQKYPDFLFLAPIVPATALFSNPIRLSRNANSSGNNPWNVESLFKALVAYSSRNEADGGDMWNRLFGALAVQNSDEDDFFARIVDRMFRECANHLKETGLIDAQRLPLWSKSENDLYSPDQFFIAPSDREVFSEASPLDEIRDGLRLILELKQDFSRWQWITIFDAHLRMSMMAFVMWLLELHHIVSVAIQKYILDGMPIPNVSDRVFYRHLASESREGSKDDMFYYGEGFSKAQGRVVARYARDAMRIAFFLDVAKDLNPAKFLSVKWDTFGGFVSSLKAFLPDFQTSTIKSGFQAGFVKLIDESKDFLNPSKGRLKHFLQFFAVLRQKAITDGQRDFIRYDQSFLVRKKGGYSRAPFIVDFGGVTCFVAAYCCAKGRRVFPKTELLNYLEKFYVKIRSTHDAQFVEHLKGLGLTMDSPDAGGGLMILNPFFGEKIR